MKTMTFNLVLKTVLIIAVFCSFTTASAEDFWDEGIQYTITSDTTVRVIRNDIFNNLLNDECFYGDINLEIPSIINYHDKVYVVTEIGDSAFYYDFDWFYDSWIYNHGGYLEKINITIPETINYIGSHAFGGEGSDEIIYVYCLSETPPVMNDSFEGRTFFYVSTEAYPLYVEENNNNHFCSYVFDINGEKSSPPICEEHYLNQPIIDICYGFTAKIYAKENTTLFIREKSQYGWSGVETNGWYSKYFSSNDSICYYFACDYSSCRGEGMEIEIFAIEEGKNPSSTIYCGEIYGDQKIGPFRPKWFESFDFIDSDISYKLRYGEEAVEVTYCGFQDPCNGGQKNEDTSNNKSLRESDQNAKSYYYDYDEFEVFPYSGDFVIPSTATEYNDYYGTYNTYPVTAIGSSAFEGCSGLTSITIPNSITYIQYNAFRNCPKLTEVNITDLAAWCNINFNFDVGEAGEIEYEHSSNPLSYAHHLYLNGTEVTDLVIPNTINRINMGCFSGCSELTSVTFHNTLKRIEMCAFLGCSGLTSVTIPNSVTCIETFAFYGCSGITDLTIGSSTTSIGWDVFHGCNGLTSVKCYGKIPAINDDEKGIVPKRIPEKDQKVEVIDYFEGDTIFEECVYQNATLYVPMDAIDAYREADGWRHFKNIVGFYAYDYVEEGVYYTITGDGEVMVVHGDDAYQGVVNIPQTVTFEGVTYNVTGICSGAFADATLESLILPVTIGAVEEGAFTNCHIHSLIITGDGTWTAGAVSCDVDNLYVMGTVTGIQDLQVNPTTVYSYPTVPPTCDEQSFTGYDGELHVPASALAAYFTAPYWCNFINIAGDAIEPTGLTVNRDSVEVLVGNQLRLTATAVPANATPNEIFWTSSDESIATVTNGIITAVKVGECDIKAYLLDKSATCHVTVTEIAPTEVILDQEYAKLEIGSQLTLTATILPEDATDKFVTWTTTNSDVATVDSLGVVTAVGQGECFVTATCRDKQAMCHIIVVDHFVFITLDEHEVRLLPNHMFTLTPSVSPANTSLVVTSSDPTVAAARMANGNIQVVGITEGTTIVTVNSTDGYAEVDSCLVKVYTLRGDVNKDGFVNISDVTALINYLLSGDADDIDTINADTDNNGKINIGDVTRLINHLLSGDELDPKEEPIEGEETFTVNGVSFTMVAVEGGTFTMGATPEQGEDALDAEKPAHQVTLSDYAIGQTEVTQALWVAVMGTNPSRFKDRPENPVEGVTWTDCQTFITQLNQMTGRNFRLLTEAEWEYAARGGNKSLGYKYAGSNDIDEVAWYDQNSTSTQPVGTKKANELGIYDMSGNVWEWCQDYYGDYSAEPQTNPTGPETGTDRIRRGVGWNGGQTNARVSHRSSRAETYKYNSLGLRLAL